MNILLLTFISLAEPEPLLAILRPSNTRIIQSHFGFTLLSLDRNRLTAATFFCCFTFVTVLRAPFVAFRTFFLFFSSNFKNENSRLKVGRWLFTFYFFRGLVLWFRDLRSLPLQLVPPKPIQQGLFESSSFIANTVGDRREFFLFSSLFGIFLARRAGTEFGVDNFGPSVVAKTTKNRWT